VNGGFIHLRAHSHYSLEDGLMGVEALVARAAELDMPALALTEQDNLFSAVKFYQAAERSGIKPIIGADLRHHCGSGRQLARMVLLCRNRQGYDNLVQLVTRAYRNANLRLRLALRKEWLHRHADGLIVLSGGREGEIGQALLAGNAARARDLLSEWLEHFPDSYYLEVQRTGRSGEDAYLDQVVALAQEFDAPLVASNDVRFLHEADFEAHEARVCVHRGELLHDAERPRFFSPNQYLRSAQEMAELFSDLPAAVDNTCAIAMRCNLELELGKPRLPEFPTQGDATQEQELRRRAQADLHLLLERHGQRDPAGTADSEQDYRQRLEEELQIITRMGLSGYFLIVADFVRWAKQQHIPVGPGRGSGGGSLVAYALGITTIDPMIHGLLFERFLNPERVSLPDIDIDFCMERRDEVIDYVVERYGRDHVSQIVTHGTMNARAAVRDAGRILGHGFGFVDRIAKCIPGALDMTLERAMREDRTLAEFYRDDDAVRSIIDLARRLEGTVRHAGRHAGGIVITPQPLTDYMPLFCEPGGEGTLTQFDMNDIEAIGLVKFDFLALKTLTVIERCVHSIREAGTALELEDVPTDDAATYRLISDSHTIGVFQLESDGMRRLIQRMQPRRFDDLVALLALFRPGPLQSGMVDHFIERRETRKEFSYEHPLLEPILRSTYGVILYQEQVMQIARSLADYSLGEADLLRRAMGKKKPEEMAKHRFTFVDKAMANGISKAKALHIFEQMEKFAGYGFNKSHSAAYALIAFHTAWLKAHHPAAFMAATMSSELDNTDRLVVLHEELKRLGMRLQPPCVNHSRVGFTVTGDACIRYGLGAIRGIGRSMVKVLEQEREQGGAYHDLFDLCCRVDVQRINVRVLEVLTLAGALDVFRVERSVLFANLENFIQAGARSARDRRSGQSDLFAAGAGATTAEAPRYQPAAAWDDAKRLEGEHRVLGIYLSGHPIHAYREELQRLVSCTLDRVRPGTPLFIAGFIERILSRPGLRGRGALLRIEDGEARLLLRVPADTYHRRRELLARDRMLIAYGNARAEEFLGSEYIFQAEEVFDLDTARARFGVLHLALEHGQDTEAQVEQLDALLRPCQDAACKQVCLDYTGDAASVQLSLPGVRVSDALLEQLRKLLGATAVRMEYSKDARQDVQQNALAETGDNGIRQEQA